MLMEADDVNLTNKMLDILSKRIHIEGVTESYARVGRRMVRETRFELARAV